MDDRNDNLILLPVLPLRGLVVFPKALIHFDVGRKKSISAINAAMKNDQLIFLVTQKDAAENLRTLLAGSKNAFEVQPSKVQDPYSLRCIPQIHGASRDAIQYVYEAVSRELNAVTDNPIVFPDEDEVISGGNFHGQPMALAFDLQMCPKEEQSVLSILSFQRDFLHSSPNTAEYAQAL